MLPVSVWYKAMEGRAAFDSVCATSPPLAAGGRQSVRRMVGRGLIRLGRAVSGPARTPRSALADGLAPR